MYKSLHVAANQYINCSFFAFRPIMFLDQSVS